MAKPLPEHMQCSPCLKIRKFRQSCVVKFIVHLFLMQMKYFGYFSCKWNILDVSHTTGIFWILLIINANKIFSTLFMQLKISLKYAVDCS